MYDETAVIAKTAILRSEKLAMWSKLCIMQPRSRLFKRELNRIRNVFKGSTPSDLRYYSRPVRPVKNVSTLLESASKDKRKYSFKNFSEVFLAAGEDERKKFIKKERFENFAWFDYLKASFDKSFDLHSLYKIKGFEDRKSWITLIINRLMQNDSETKTLDRNFINKLIPEPLDINEAAVKTIILQENDELVKYTNALAASDGSTKLRHISLIYASRPELLRKIYPAISGEYFVKFFIEKIEAASCAGDATKIFWFLLEALLEDASRFQECRNIFCERVLKGDYQAFEEWYLKKRNDENYKFGIAEEITAEDDLEKIESHRALIDRFFLYIYDTGMSLENAGRIFAEKIVKRIVNSDLINIFYAFGKYLDFYSERRGILIEASQKKMKDSLVLTEAFIMGGKD